MRDDVEKLMSIHDGESTGEHDDDQASPLDAESREFLDRLKAADEAFAAEANELLAMPVPDKLLQTIRAHDAAPAATSRQSTAVESGDKRDAATATATAGSAEIIPFFRRPRTIARLALAAGLAAVVVTNLEWLRVPGAPTLDLQASADHELFQQSMHRAVSGDLQQSAEGSLSVMPVSSFVTQDKVLCREFLALQGATEFSGVACYDASSGWALKHAQIIEGSQEASTYQMATGDDAATTIPAIDNKAVQLSPAEELRAIESGWQSCGTSTC